jgi:hypothetical protein
MDDVRTVGTTAPSPCPSCGSDRVVRRAFGFPGPEMWEAARAGAIKLGGCVIGPVERWEDDWHCWACADRDWLAEHERREHREGRTAHDCSDHGLLWDPDSNQNGVRLGMQDVSDRFRPAGFIDRLWPYLRDVPDGAPAWRPNAERIGAAIERLDVHAPDATGSHPDRITEDELLTLGTLQPRAEARLHDRLERIATALATIPTDLELHTLDTVAYERTVGKWSPAQGVVDILGSLVRGPSSAALHAIARRRPALLAERHPLVDAALGIPTDRQVWRPWWRTLTADPGLIERLERLRTQLDAPDLPLLRIAWLSVLTREQDAADAGGPSASLDLPEARWFRCPWDGPPSQRTTPIWVGTDPTLDGEDVLDNELSRWLETETTLAELSEDGQRRVREYIAAKEAEQQREQAKKSVGDGDR